MSWTPLLILPGVALMVMSTSVRYARIHDELHHVIEHMTHAVSIPSLIHRARLFRNALVLLYSSVFVLATAGLVNALGVETIAFTGAGVLLLVAASGTLCLEAIESFRVFEEEAAGLLCEMAADEAS